MSFLKIKKKNFRKIKWSSENSNMKQTEIYLFLNNYPDLEFNNRK